ncbi:MAG: beta-hexosaminidase [Herbinix sp.]|jgi:beta-N-acetylhexosaminidase|nr:beta-hexosaminidase [Herbinix sp.]
MKKIIRFSAILLLLLTITACSKNDSLLEVQGNNPLPSEDVNEKPTDPTAIPTDTITDPPEQELTPVPTEPQTPLPSETPLPSPSNTPSSSNAPSSPVTEPITPKPEDTSSTNSPTTVPTNEQTQMSNEKIVDKIINNMSLEEKVGQLFFVRIRDLKALEDIKEFHLGGYILFAEDVKDKTYDELKETLHNYQKTANIPLLIGVDEEGGTVNRISKYPEFRSTPFLSPQDLYKKGGLDQIKKDTKEKAKLLKDLGINVNLAPVCDVSTNPEDFIYERSFGKDAYKTATYVSTIVKEMSANGLGSTLKHFPGYGNNVDTHTGIAIDKRSYDTFVNSDFIPFQAGIKAGAGSILVSHNIVMSMDETYPASLSPAVHKLLREDLGFEGVIMTDDLSMDAILEYTDKEEAAVQAILAGNDLIIASDFDIQIPAVIEALKEKTIDEDRIDESLRRILLWKMNLGIITKTKSK